MTRPRQHVQETVELQWLEDCIDNLLLATCAAVCELAKGLWSLGVLCWKAYSARR